MSLLSTEDKLSMPLDGIIGETSRRSTGGRGGRGGGGGGPVRGLAGRRATRRGNMSPYSTAHGQQRIVMAGGGWGGGSGGWNNS